MQRTADEFVVSDSDKLVHRGTRHVLGDDDGARDTKDLTESRLAILV